MTDPEREAMREFIVSVVRAEAAKAVGAIDKESLRGPPGKDGVDGLNGKDGHDGKDGAEGIQGKDGLPGMRGSDGANGRDGIDGKDGAQGKRGEKGMDGKDGRDGLHGKDGTNGRDGVATKDELMALLKGMLAAATPEVLAEVKMFVQEEIGKLPVLVYRGVYQLGQEYTPGNTATWAGSLWHCNTQTKEKPGTNGDWTLAVKKGRDGKGS